MSEKKVVRYVVVEGLTNIALGNQAYINTIDHPELSNRQAKDGNVTITSPVVLVDENGIFETANTRYLRVHQLNG